MARLEDILPEIRKGRKVRCLSRTNHIIMLKGKQLTYEDLSYVCPVQLTSEDILSDDWEIVPEPVKVADYLQPDPFSMSVSGKCSRWVSKTYPVGQQPEGSVMVPKSERNATE